MNKIRYKKCGDVIESFSVHDFKYCKCGSVAIDGGYDYLRRLGWRGDWEELSQCEAIDKSCENIIDIKKKRATRLSHKAVHDKKPIS